MKITVLVENSSRIDNYLLAEPALSFLIETDNKKILFDTGYSDVFLKNAKTMGINLNTITDIVLSHGHDDHTGGLKYFKPQNNNNNNIKLTAHPDIFDKKFDKNGIPYGCPVSKEDLEDRFTLNLTRKTYYLTENLLFLGEVENNISDEIDDSALAYIIGNKLLIITGCSHSGIKNIINYAKKITGINQIYGIIGGMHLIGKTKEETAKLGKFFKEQKIEYLAPCHCCDLNSKIILSRYNLIHEICTGDIIEFQ